MKVLLLRDQKIMHRAGEIVEVSPSVCAFLVNTHSAEPVRAEVKTEKPATKKKR